MAGILPKDRCSHKAGGLSLLKGRRSSATYFSATTSIKTALTMGYNDAELTRLDERLEKLIGKEKLDQIMRGESSAMASADLLDTELDRELERLRTIRDKR